MSMRYLIVGAGLCGHQAALELSRSANATVTLIGAERRLPYDRPPLSKELLSVRGEINPAQFSLAKPPSIYADRGIQFHPGVTAIAIDRALALVRTDDGQGLSYDRLLLTTGSRPRELSFWSASADQGVYLRTLEDALHLRNLLTSRQRLVVIGGGFIGLEVASSARLLGCDVTILEASQRLLSRTSPPYLSDWVLDLHRSRGVVVELDAPVSHIGMLPGGGYELAVGARILRTDALLVGIGVIPNVDLAQACGLTVNDGIVVDDYCRTNDPKIFAAGEVTAHPNRPDGKLRRIESWRTSMDHGTTAARNMAGHQTRFDNVPWFWSDQLGQNIQSIGFPAEGRRFSLVEGSGEASWTLIAYTDADEVVGAVAANRGRDIAMLKRVMLGKHPPPATIPAGLDPAGLRGVFRPPG